MPASLRCYFVRKNRVCGTGPSAGAHIVGMCVRKSAEGNVWSNKDKQVLSWGWGRLFNGFPDVCFATCYWDNQNKDNENISGNGQNFHWKGEHFESRPRQGFPWLGVLWGFLTSSRNLKEGAIPDWAAASAFPIFFSSPFTNKTATYTRQSEIQCMLK
jgi:hypothetical protein